MPICTNCKSHFGNRIDLERHTCGEALKPLTKKEQIAIKKEEPKSILSILGQ